MFLVDISPSMGATRTVELPPGPGGEERSVEMTNLEWALQFVKFKIQEMVRCTDQYREVRADMPSDIRRAQNGPVWSHCVWVRPYMLLLLFSTVSYLLGRIGTENIVNEKQGGYQHIEEYIPIGTPNSGTLVKLDELRPSETYGDREFHFSTLQRSQAERNV